MAEFNNVSHNRGYQKATNRDLKESNKATSRKVSGFDFNLPGGGTVRVALKTIRFLSGLMSRVFGEGKPLFDFTIAKVENSKVQAHVQAKEKAQETEYIKPKKEDIKFHLKKLGYRGRHLKTKIDNIRELPVADQMEALSDTPSRKDYLLGYSSNKDIIEDKQVAFKTLKDIGYSEKTAEKIFLTTKTRSESFSFRSTLYKMLAAEVRSYKNNFNQDHSSSANLFVDNGAVSMDIERGRVFYSKSGTSKKSTLVKTKDQRQHSTDPTKSQDLKAPQKKSKPAVDISSHSTPVDNGSVSIDIEHGSVSFKK